MQRLTEKTKDCFGYRLKDGSDSEVGFFKNYDAFYSHMMMVRELGEYEDLEEQGLLLRLPCKVGTEFYYVGQKAIKGELKNKWEICATYVSSFEVLGEEIIIYDNVGLDYNMNNIFLAKEEAEAKLREMEE